jgi:hypothetical protein
MMFPPVLLFSSYLNLSGYKKDSAGITAAWSGLYALLAMRRKHVSTEPTRDGPWLGGILTCVQRLKQKFGARGIVRGASLGLCAVNVAAGGLAYVFGKREEDES